MNSSNVANITNESELKDYFDQIRETIIDYGIRGASIMGILFNPLTILIMANSQQFKNKYYNFLRCRCVCNFLVCAVGIFIQSTPCEQSHYDYWNLHFLMYAVQFTTRIVLLASAISDNLLILNRFYNLFPNEKIAFDSLSKKANLLICFLPGVLVVFPVYFSFKIVKLSSASNETEGYWTLTDFGKSRYWKAYTIFVLIFEFVIPLVSLTILNCFSIYKYKQIMRNKRRLAQAVDNRTNKADRRFTTFVITLSLVLIVTRTFDTAASIFYRSTLFGYITLSDEMNVLVKLIKAISFFLLIAAHAFDGLLYYFYDLKMRSLIDGFFKQCFCRSK